MTTVPGTRAPSHSFQQLALCLSTTRDTKPGDSRRGGQSPAPHPLTALPCPAQLEVGQWRDSGRPSPPALLPAPLRAPPTLLPFLPPPHSAETRGAGESGGWSNLSIPRGTELCFGPPPPSTLRLAPGAVAKHRCSPDWRDPRQLCSPLQATRAWISLLLYSRLACWRTRFKAFLFGRDE